MYWTIEPKATPVWKTLAFQAPHVAGDHSWDCAIEQLLHKMLVSNFPVPSLM
jgi:hypothetical protein